MTSSPSRHRVHIKPTKPALKPAKPTRPHSRLPFFFCSSRPPFVTPHTSPQSEANHLARKCAACNEVGCSSLAAFLTCEAFGLSKGGRPRIAARASCSSGLKVSIEPPRANFLLSFLFITPFATTRFFTSPLLPPARSCPSCQQPPLTPRERNAKSTPPTTSSPPSPSPPLAPCTSPLQPVNITQSRKPSIP